MKLFSWKRLLNEKKSPWKKFFNWFSFQLLFSSKIWLNENSHFILIFSVITQPSKYDVKTLTNLGGFSKGLEFCP